MSNRLQRFTTSIECQNCSMNFRPRPFPYEDLEGKTGYQQSLPELEFRFRSFASFADQILRETTLDNLALFQWRVLQEWRQFQRNKWDSLCRECWCGMPEDYEALANNFTSRVLSR